MISTGRCAARAALAGNPSDGYGGFVVAVPVRGAAATVTVTPADRFEVVHSPTADDTFASLGELVDHVDRFGTADARSLVLATLRAVVRSHRAQVSPCRIEVSTDIPRSVGLAGSSAIIIATLRALIAASPDAPWATTLADEPDALARLALSVETEELGLAAGLQDRLVQCHDRPVAMDFANHSTRPLGPVPGASFVAYRTAAAEASTVVHSNLRSDYDGDVGATRSTLGAIAAAGRSAAAAVDAHDVDALCTAMHRTLDLRAELLTLDAPLLAAAACVRAAGGAANWTGSGGAIVVVTPLEVDVDALRSRLVSEHGCAVLSV